MPLLVAGIAAVATLLHDAGVLHALACALCAHHLRAIDSAPSCSALRWLLLVLQLLLLPRLSGRSMSCSSGGELGQRCAVPRRHRGVFQLLLQHPHLLLQAADALQRTRALGAGSNCV